MDTETDDQPVIPKQINPRDLRIAQLARERTDALDIAAGAAPGLTADPNSTAATGVVDADDPDGAPAGQDAAAVAAAIAAAADRAAPPAKAAAAAPAKASTDAGDYKPYEKDGVLVVKQKVLGVEREVPLETVLRNAQIHEATEERLREATRLRQEAQEAHRQSMQRLQQLNAAPAIQAASLSNDELAAQLTPILDRHYNGDVEGAAKELANIIGSTRQPAVSITPEIIAATVRTVVSEDTAQSAARTRQQQMVDAANEFQRDFADMAADPRLASFVDVESARILATNPEKSPSVALREAAENVKGLMTAVTATPSDKKLDAKRNLQRVESGSAVPSVKHNPPAAAQKPDPSKVIADLRKARGQA